MKYNPNLELPAGLRLTIADKMVYQAHSKVICKMLATYYLNEFNRINQAPNKPTGKNGNIVHHWPPEYLNKKDCLRELQYLCEYWRIKAFELEGANPSLW